MSKHFKNPITSEAVLGVRDAVKSDIERRYGESPAREEAAKQAHYYAEEFLFNRPIGMTQDYTRGDLRNDLQDYVIKKMSEEPKGFLFGGEFIILAILSGIISWCVKKLLDRLFELN